jgi:hypothetical protein
MNALVSFRLCTLSDVELMEAVDSKTDEMYQTGKIPDRQIPARPNKDYDLLVGELVQRFRALVNIEPTVQVSDTTPAQSESLTPATNLLSLRTDFLTDCTEVDNEKIIVSSTPDEVFDWFVKKLNASQFEETNTTTN